MVASNNGGRSYHTPLHALHPQFPISQEALAILSNTIDARGRMLQVIKVPVPPPLHYTASEAAGVAQMDGVKARVAGERLAASYINFYFCNGGVVMPGFGVEAADAAALAVVTAAFPERRVVQVQTREIVLGGGNIHCITQQQPRGWL
jgi:agmatine deiminase